MKAKKKYSYHQLTNFLFFHMFINFVLIVFTCDLADSEVIPSAALRVPGRALDTVGSPCFKVIEGHRGISGVQLEAGAGALSDNAERVEDSVLNRGPGHKDGVVARGGGVQLGRNHHYRQDKQRVMRVNEK